MNHDERIKTEFARQADALSVAPLFTDQDVLSRIVAAMGPTLGCNLLDVGCGPGIVTAALADVAAMVIGVDSTPEMLDKARRRCAAQGLSNVQFELGAAETLPFESARFDAIVTRLTLHHFAEPLPPLAEMARVIRPGGRLVVSDIVASDDPEAAALHNAVEILRDPSHVRMLTADELVGLVESAGLDIIATERWEMRREAEEWLRIASAPERVQPLSLVMRALALSGISAGMNLRLEGGEIAFTHSWILVTAHKGAAPA